MSPTLGSVGQSVSQRTTTRCNFSSSSIPLLEPPFSQIINDGWFANHRTDFSSRLEPQSTPN